MKTKKKKIFQEISRKGYYTFKESHHNVSRRESLFRDTSKDGPDECTK